MAIVHMDAEIIGYHCLNKALDSNYEALKALLAAHGSWTAAWHDAKSAYPDINQEKEAAFLAKLDIALILGSNSEFPALLAEIPWKPHGIYVKGKLPVQPGIGIVGTRKATDAGKKIAYEISKELAALGMAVVSGLALGIDAAAHEGALAAGGITAAVLATGLDTAYPAHHANLAAEILRKGGALISEYPPASASYPSRFIHRNRIISGLSRGIVAVEAPEKSGSLATARFALEQNREVFVVPGPATHENYAGSHDLIRAGARLITAASHILEDLNLEPEPTAPEENTLFTGATDEERQILGIIKETGWPTSIDKIAEISKIEVRKINQIIARLTIKGTI